jgi:ferredoxin-NADP reductase
MRVERVVDYTAQIREIFASPEQAFSFKAGQFVMLRVPAEPKPILRAYSIASDARRSDRIRLVFKQVEGGPATQFVWGLKGGETLEFTGPFGRVFFQEPPSEQVLFLNTGSGVSQHASFLSTYADRYPGARYRLLFGVRREADIYYREELEALRGQIRDFAYHYVLSRPSAEWQGKRGYVQNHMDEYDWKSIPTTFYLCGNGAMIKDVKQRLLGSGIEPGRILSEAFD